MWCGQGHLLRDLTGGAGPGDCVGPGQGGQGWWASESQGGMRRAGGILGQSQCLTCCSGESTKALSPPWQRCSHCTRLGASIPCRSPGCPRLYHFPCATASGSFLSMKTLQLLCPEHSEGATHLGEKSCPLDGGQMRVQGCWGLRTLQNTQKSTVTYCPSAPLKYVWPL